MKLDMDKKTKFISPNPELTAEYDELIKNNPEEFIKLFNEKRIKTTCISPTQAKFLKKVVKKQNKKAAIQSLKIIWMFLKVYKISLFWLILVTILSAVMLCLASFGLQQLTQLLSGELNQTALLNYGFTLLAFYFLSSAMMWFQTRIMAIISQKIGYKIREQLFSKIQKLPVKYFDQNSSGDLMSKFINDVNNITDALSQNITIILNSIFTIISMLLCMFLMSAYLSLITLTVVPFMFLPMLFVVKKAEPFFKQTQIMLGKVNGYVEEMISGQSVINLFNQSENVSKEFKKINNELKKYARKSQAAMSIMFPYANFFSFFLIALITVIGIIFIDKGIDFAGITIPPAQGLILKDTDGVLPTPEAMQAAQAAQGLATLAIFSVMTRAFLMPFAQIANVMNTIMAALAGASRAFSVFDEKDEINEFEHIVLSIAANTRTKRETVDVSTLLKNIDSEPVSNESNKEKLVEKKLDNIHLDDKQEVLPKDLVEKVETNGSVKIENLDFSYVPEKQILFDVNIDAKEGQKVAIVGPTGSGKSTIINLLTKFYDIENGDILIGGDVSIKEITKHSMRKNVSIVLQDTYLFNVSVKDNIKCGNLDATDEEVINAAKIANAHQFIMQLPDGYDTVFDDNGDSLSQGQRQLLAIARAVLVKSSILILDEATSSIDSKTEIEIQNAMLRLMENKTSFIIAHRLSTIENADQILVLRDGRITERGTHQELLAKKGFYYDLHNSQFFEEE